MNRIEKVFEKKAFIPFITGGDPDIKTTEKLIIALEEAGADLIEIGIPFSDPVAEGVVIQEAYMRALSSGCTADKLFDMIKRVRNKVNIPLVFMTYINPIYTYGKERFMKGCKQCGIDGVIVPDLPFEEKDEIDSVCDKYGISLVSLIAPTSGERIEKIAKEAKGFLYCVSSLGVTGVRSEINSNIEEMINHVKKVSSIPCAIGFGISTPEQAHEMSNIADGIIVGSAIVRLIAEYKEYSIDPVKEYVKSMKAQME